MLHRQTGNSFPWCIALLQSSPHTLWTRAVSNTTFKLATLLAAARRKMLRVPNFGRKSRNEIKASRRDGTQPGRGKPCLATRLHQSPGKTIQREQVTGSTQGMSAEMEAMTASIIAVGLGGPTITAFLSS